VSPLAGVTRCGSPPSSTPPSDATVQHRVLSVEPAYFQCQILYSALTVSALETVGNAALSLTAKFMLASLRKQAWSN